MRICAYVQERYSKGCYKNECMDTRQFVGLRVVIDCLERAGYAVEYAGLATVHTYDVVLVSLTSDCDWWPFIAERMRWRPGDYRVLIGGAGVLHVAPFLRWFDAAMFGRGEELIVPLVRGIERGERWKHESVCWADTFSPERIYRIAQTDRPYGHRIRLSAKRDFCEGPIGCNHRCLFCGYTWHRRFVSPYREYRMEDSLFGAIEDRERAMLDLDERPGCIDWARLRTTAMDGFSERLRVGVNKKITRIIMQRFLEAMLRYEGAPHQIKLYNICGYPTETVEDWREFGEALREADGAVPARTRPWNIVLHSTPFRPMPATPMACAPASKRSYRGEMGRTLGAGLGGNLIYQGRSLWAVESMGTDSLATVMLSMIAHRGGEGDSEAIARLCGTPKFWTASAAQREATLCRHFDMDRLFGPFTPQTLPSRYLRTYCAVERMWGRTPLEVTGDGKGRDDAEAVPQRDRAQHAQAGDVPGGV